MLAALLPALLPAMRGACVRTIWGSHVSSRPADLRLAIDLFDHPKWLRLGSRLGCNAQIALLRLWAWAAKHRPSGVLTGIARDELGTLVGYHTSSDGNLFADLGEVLQDLGWIDVATAPSGKVGLVSLHDWDEHQPWVAGAKARSEAARERAEARWSNRPDARRNASRNASRNAQRNASRNARRNAPLPTPPVGGDAPLGAPSGGPPTVPAPRETSPEPDSEQLQEELGEWSQATVGVITDELVESIAAGHATSAMGPRPRYATVLSTLASLGAPPRAVRQAIAALRGRMPADPGDAFTTLREALRGALPVQRLSPPTGR